MTTLWGKARTTSKGLHFSGTAIALYAIAGLIIFLALSALL